MLNPLKSFAPMIYFAMMLFVFTAHGTAFGQSQSAQCRNHLERRAQVERICVQSGMSNSPACQSVKSNLEEIDQRLTKMGCEFNSSYNYGSQNSSAASESSRTYVCLNTENPTCENYRNCIESACNCSETEYDYPIAYGEKYCKRFLGNTNFSSKGQVWRDKTLSCLQEEIFKALPKDDEECDCKKIQTVAYKSHVDCYIRPFGNEAEGVCYLSAADYKQIIWDTVDFGDLTDSEGLNAAWEVAKQCAPMRAAYQFE